MFSSIQIVLLVFALAFYVAAAFFLSGKNQKLVSVFLFASGLCVFAFAALLDNFLNVWDERFHALVAKNMMTFPLKPMLYADPVLAKDYSAWYTGHIWLHKQPLFMWQMALSMKLFGQSIFAMRLPGVLMSALTVVALFRSGTLLSNKITGFFAAAIMLTSFYWMELVTGRNQLDQNDVAFINYVSLSVWALLEYHFSQQKRWLILVGIFSGGAILCKWLAGLFVYAVWGLLAISAKSDWKKEFINLAISLAITAVVALPWQVYAYANYPSEFKAEQEYNAIHLWESVEGHSGEATYYYDLIQNHYGLAAGWFLAVLLLLFAFLGENSRLKRSLIGAFLVQFVFFSLVATKMPSFALVGWFIAVLAMGFSLQLLIDLIARLPKLVRYKFVILMVFAVALIPLRLSLFAFEERHTVLNDELNYPKAMLHNKAVFEGIELDKNEVLFNVNGMHVVDAMFYLNNPVYGGFPTLEQIEELKQKGRAVVVLRGEGELPEHIKENPSIRIIEGFTYVYE